MSERTVYYLAGEKAAALVQEYWDKAEASHAAHIEYMKSVGAVGVYIDGTLDFEDLSSVPAGLKRYARRQANRGMYYTDRSEAGKAIKARYAEVPRYPSRYDLGRKLRGADRLIWLDRRYGVQKVGDRIIITAEKDWVAPIDSTPIKASEYWLMVEAGEE